ncbi:MAG: PKD domain-containing protein [Candidatus Omnitrophica bacterium]|nr:PKD domain-containing protein [Candidatus Omnitrophota bacterium]
MTSSKIGKTFLALLLLVCAGTLSYAYEVPYDDSNVRYFYVFGTDGDVLQGKEDSLQEIFIDVPADAPGDVVISVFDPNTGGMVDWKVPGDEWDTKCEFAVSGSKLLDKKEFGAEPEYDKQYYDFGPYKKEDGEKIAAGYRFKVTVKGLSGRNENLFNLKIKPAGAEAFVKDMTFRLLPRQGDKMYFYPEVPAGTTGVTVENYDLDVDGGHSVLAVSALAKRYPINDSESGQWSSTEVPVSVSEGGRLVYTVTKATQTYANAGVRFKDAQGNVLPIYFKKGKPAVPKEAPKAEPVKAAAPAPAPKKAAPAPVKVPDLKCNKYTFDATSSYDVDRQKLSYLWDFGDGQTSTEPVVTHVYAKGGEYNVRLTVVDDSGLPCDSGSTSQKIVVNTPPAASFAAPEKSCAGDAVRLDASATTDDNPANLTYNWNFGDGEKGEGKTVTHTYAKGGKYNVCLTVNDNSGTECSVDAVQKQVLVNTAPVADAGGDISRCLRANETEYTVSLSGSGSRDADGDTLEYIWDFGDGSTGNGKDVTHTYSRGGNYTARLTVDDGSGLSCSRSMDSIKIDLNKQPLAAAGDDMDICTGETVSFDGTKSVADGGSATYQWSFGDGTTATGPKVTHTYDKSGKYVVNLTVDDGKATACSSATDSLHVMVNGKPSASIADVEDTCAGRKVSFDASASKDEDGDGLTYSWDFGDGVRESTGAKTSHVYEKGGTYYVTVTVDDGKNSKCSSSIDSVRVKVNTPPSVEFLHIPACCVDMDQKFDASATNDPDGDTLSYRWDFGDGSTGEGVKVSHAYTEPGKYKVVLTVDDASGAECSQNTSCSTVTVFGKPVPVIKIK